MLTDAAKANVSNLWLSGLRQKLISQLDLAGPKERSLIGP